MICLLCGIEHDPNGLFGDQDEEVEYILNRWREAVGRAMDQAVFGTELLAEPDEDGVYAITEAKPPVRRELP